MRAWRILLSVGLLFGASSIAGATPITVNFIFAGVPPDPTLVSLPYEMNNTNDVAFLKFKIPQIDDVLSINSFTVAVNFFDDGDPGTEHGRIFFAQPGPNIFLTEFFSANGATAGSPLIVTSILSPTIIDQIFPSILDGNFRLRIERESGDYFLASGTAIIDANLASQAVPEPMTLLMTIGGLAVAARRARSRTRKGDSSATH